MKKRSFYFPQKICSRLYQGEEVKNIKFKVGEKKEENGRTPHNHGNRINRINGNRKIRWLLQRNFHHPSLYEERKASDPNVMC